MRGKNFQWIAPTGCIMPLMGKHHKDTPTGNNAQTQRVKGSGRPKKGDTSKRKVGQPSKPNLFCQLTRQEMACAWAERLGAAEILVYCFLRTWAVNFGKGQDSMSNKDMPSYAEMAEQLGMPYSTFRRAVDGLRKARLVRVIKKSRKGEKVRILICSIHAADAKIS
jgi:DNA-binding transcriptional ArsR family regulator